MGFVLISFTMPNLLKSNHLAPPLNHHCKQQLFETSYNYIFVTISKIKRTLSLINAEIFSDFKIFEVFYLAQSKHCHEKILI